MATKSFYTARTLALMLITMLVHFLASPAWAGCGGGADAQQQMFEQAAKTRVVFSVDSVRPTVSEKAKIRSQAAWLLAHPEFKVVVGAYCPDILF